MAPMSTTVSTTVARHARLSSGWTGRRVGRGLGRPFDDDLSNLEEAGGCGDGRYIHPAHAGHGRQVSKRRVRLDMVGRAVSTPIMTAISAECDD